MSHPTDTGNIFGEDPRERRAHRFTSVILSVMRDFVPRDRECQRRMQEELFKLAYEGNVEIINVPPECDALDKLALERRMYETKVAAVIPAADQSAPLQSLPAHPPKSA